MARIDVSKYGAAATTDIKTSEATPSSANFQTSEIEGADAMVHTHPTNETSPVPGGDSKSGDWQAPGMGIANYAVHGSKTVIAVEISGGQIRARIVKGRSSSSESRALRQPLNRYQQAGEKY